MGWELGLPARTPRQPAAAVENLLEETIGGNFFERGNPPSPLPLFQHPRAACGRSGPFGVCPSGHAHVRTQRAFGHGYRASGRIHMHTQTDTHRYTKLSFSYILDCCVALRATSFFRRGSSPFPPPRALTRSHLPLAKKNVWLNLGGAGVPPRSLPPLQHLLASGNLRPQLLFRGNFWRKKLVGEFWGGVTLPPSPPL